MSNQVEVVTPEAVQVSIELQEGTPPEIVLNAPTIPVVVELNAPLLQQPVAAVREQNLLQIQILRSHL